MINKDWQNLDYIIEKLSNFKKRIADNKVARFVFAIIFVLVALLALLPLFLNNELLKSESVKKINEVFESNLIVKGDVRIQLLPTPAIIAHDVLLQRYQAKNSKYIFSAYAKSVKINFSFLSLKKIKKITLIGALIERKEGESGQISNGEEIQNIILSLKEKYKNKKHVADFTTSISYALFSSKNNDKSIFDFKILPQVKLENSRFISYNQREEKKEYNSLFLSSNIGNKRISAEGGFVVANIPSSFETLLVFDDKLRSKPNSYLQIKSPSLKLRFDGNLAGKKDSFDFDVKGNVAMEINDLKNFYLSYLGQSKSIADKLKSSTPIIKLSAVISSTDDEKAVTNLRIESPIVNGEGSAYIGFSDSKVPIIDLDLDLKDIDLDAIWSGNPVKQVAELKIPIKEAKDEVEALDDLIKVNILGKDFDLIAEIKADFVRYKNNSLGNLNIYVNAYNRGEILIAPLSFDFPGEGKFYANGILSKEESVKFVGKIHVLGKDFSALSNNSAFESKTKFDVIKDYELYSDVALSPSRIELYNFFLRLEDGPSEISGIVNFDISNSVPTINAELSVNEIDATKYLENFKIAEYINGGILLRKVFWLNEVDYNGFFKLKFDKIHYKSQEFKHNSGNFSISRGKIGLNNVVLNKDLSKIESSLIVDISKNTPYLEFRLNADNLEIANDSSAKSSDKIINEFELSKMNSQFFKLTSLEGFSGILNVNLPNFKFKNRDLKDVAIKSNLNNGIFEGLSISFKNLASKFDYAGTLGIKQTRTLSGILKIDNINISSILNIADINNVSGISNMASSFSSYGKNGGELIKNLEGEVKANINGLVVGGFGLNDLVQKMFLPKKYFLELKEPNLVLENKDAKTVFQKSSASIKVKDGVADVKSNISGLAFNSVLSGKINLTDYESNLMLNTIFITGTRKKQIPINIATNFNGKFNNLSNITNYDQILQYLGLKKVEKAPVINKQETQNQGAPNVVQDVAPQENIVPNQVIIEQQTN